MDTTKYHAIEGAIEFLKTRAHIELSMNPDEDVLVCIHSAMLNLFAHKDLFNLSTEVRSQKELPNKIIPIRTK